MENPNFEKRVSELKRQSLKNKLEPVHSTTKKIVVERELVSIEHLLTMEFDVNRWLVEGLIPAEGINIVSGPPGNFKTWLVLHMGIAIARGEKFVNEFPCTQSGVLIIDEEDHLRLLKERVVMLGATKDLPLYFLSLRGFNVDEESWRKKVLDMCKEHNIDTIFLDSLVRVHSGNENDATDMSKVFKNLRVFCQQKKTLILTHHERKEGKNKSSAQNRMRGSGDILAALDSHIAVRKSEDSGNLSVEHTKMKYGQEVPSFEIVINIEEERMSFHYLGVQSKKETLKEKAEETILKILEKNKLSVKEVLEHSKSDGLSEKIAKETLEKMIEKGLVIKEKGIKNTQLCSLVPRSES
jgi:RecA-family ATPase